jgi:hypothetical protein
MPRESSRRRAWRRVGGPGRAKIRRNTHPILLTSRGLKLGSLLVKLRTRLLIPLATLVAAPTPRPETTNTSEVGAAFRQVDRAIDHLCIMLGLEAAA